MSSELIFLVSAPRSGSTLLQSILSNNPFVATANEPWLLFHFIGFQNPHLFKASFNYELAYEATARLLQSTERQDKVVEDLREFLYKLYSNLIIDNQARYILDKTPRYYEILPTIRSVFPNSKIILLKRNPLSVLNSIIETWGIDNMTQLYEYRRDLLVAPYLINQFENNVKEENCLVIKYEDLISDTEKEVFKIFNWLDIPFEKEVLNFSQNAKLKGEFGDKSIKVQKGKTLKNPDRWQVKLSEKKWQSFFSGYASFLGKEFMQEYGYPLEIKMKRTQQFETYKYMCSKGIPGQNPIGGIFQYLFQRTLYHFYSKY